MTQRSFGGALNHRPVRHRIAKRHPQLDQGGACAREFNYQFAGRFEIRIAGGDKRDEPFFTFAFEVSECFGDSIQTNLRQRKRRISSFLSAPLCPLWLFAPAQYQCPYRHVRTN